MEAHAEGLHLRRKHLIREAFVSQEQTFGSPKLFRISRPALCTAPRGEAHDLPLGHRFEVETKPAVVPEEKNVQMPIKTRNDKGETVSTAHITSDFGALAYDNVCRAVFACDGYGQPPEHRAVRPNFDRICPNEIVITAFRALKVVHRWSPPRRGSPMARRRHDPCAASQLNDFQGRPVKPGTKFVGQEDEPSAPYEAPMRNCS